MRVAATNPKFSAALSFHTSADFGRLDICCRGNRAVDKRASSTVCRSDNSGCSAGIKNSVETYTDTDPLLHVNRYSFTGATEASENTWCLHDIVGAP